MVDYETIHEALKKELIKDECIIDGNYQRTLDLRLLYADTVIFLDFETEFCLNSWNERVRKQEIRTDMPENCIEFYDPEFEAYIKKFNIEKRPGIIESLKKYQGKVYILTSRDEVNNFLNSIN